MNIMDGMDAARYKSGNPDSGKKDMGGRKHKKTGKVTPRVIRDLKNS